MAFTAKEQEAIDKSNKKKPLKFEGRIPLKEGLAKSKGPSAKDTNETLALISPELAEMAPKAQDIPLRPQGEQPSMIQKAQAKVPKKEAQEASKSIDKLAKTATGDKGFKLSENAQVAFMGALPVLLGGILGGDDGIAAGAKAASVGVGALQKGEAAVAQGERADRELDIKEEEIQAKAQASKTANISKLLGLKAAGEKDILSRTIPTVGTGLTKEDSTILKEKKATLDNVTGGIDRLSEIGNRNLATLSPEQRTEAQTEVQALIGQLRIPLTGPGPLTDTEREFMEGIIGNPTKIFSLASNERVKLETIKKKFIGDFQNEADLRTVEGLHKSKIKDELAKRGL